MPICTKIVSFVFIIAYIVFTRLVTNERTDGRTTNTQHYACIQSILVEASKSAIVIFVSVQSRPGGDLMFSICPSVRPFVRYQSCCRNTLRNLGVQSYYNFTANLFKSGAVSFKYPVPHTLYLQYVYQGCEVFVHVSTQIIL